MDLFCRACMLDLANYEHSSSEDICSMFCYCTNIEIANGKQVKFCTECSIKLQNCYAFVLEAHRIDALLKRLLEQEENDKDSVIDHEINQTDNLIQVQPPNIINTKFTSFDDNLEFMNEKFTSDVQIAQSAKEIQIKEKGKIVCQLCRKTFQSHVWYVKHRKKVHSDEKLQGSMCDTCGLKFKHQQDLENHCLSHNTNLFSCKACNKGFKMKSHLHQHMKMHKRQYLCSLCGTIFTHVANLTVHMRTHTGEKPYECNECTFKCSVQSSMRRHQRWHRGHRAYGCRDCHKRFYDRSGLIRHERIHTGELPYKCPFCQRSFIDNWKRKTHMMRLHTLSLHEIPKMKRDGTF